MPVLSRDREEDVPERSGQEISWIFFRKNPGPGKWHMGMQTSSRQSLPFSGTWRLIKKVVPLNIKITESLDKWPERYQICSTCLWIR